MTGLAAAGRTVLDRCGADEDVEVYGLHRLTTRVDVGDGGTLRNVGRSEVCGVGIRVITGRRLGYASTNDLSASGLTAALDAAREHTTVTEPDDGNLLPEPTTVPASGVPFAPVPVEAAIASAVELARRAATLDPRVPVVDTATFREERATLLIASTRGVRAEHTRASTELLLDVVAPGHGPDHGVLTGFGYGWAMSPDDLDPDAVAAEAVDQAVALLEPAGRLPSGLPVLLSPEVAAAVITAVGRAFTGPALDHRSPFAGRHGETVAAPVVTLTDDGLCPRSAHAAPFDDEGVPRRRTTLIDRGKAVGALHTTATAPDGRSTGNARRGSHKSLPGVAPTTLRLDPAGLVEVTDAVHVHQLSGEGAGISPVTGKVDVGVSATLIAAGEPAGSLPQLGLSTTLEALLEAVVGVGDDDRPVMGSPVLAPTVLLRPGLL
ncbi:TldD/PmbA family protein [Actinomycetospora sp. CA-084318]|uniref:TldD/PmbA family protein n=1 Tax=Actinomycetospora sp. CA-084318 TaxID=3239892 RepID=UPI003D961D82